MFLLISIFLLSFLSVFLSFLILFIVEGINFWLAKPGFTVIIKTPSISSNTSSNEDNGVDGLIATKALASEVAKKRITVNAVAPGFIRTDMTATVTEKYEKLIAEGLLPIARMGVPEDIAKAVSALASGALPYSTGEVINIDGGFHIRTL